jgi:hypothetical protein
MAKMDFDAVFGSVKLAVRPAVAADGATIAVIEEPVAEVAGVMPFFGGYAEDMLADIGFDVVEDTAARGPRTRIA